MSKLVGVGYAVESLVKPCRIDIISTSCAGVKLNQLLSNCTSYIPG